MASKPMYRTLEKRMERLEAIAPQRLPIVIRTVQGNAARDAFRAEAERQAREQGRELFEIRRIIVSPKDGYVVNEPR
jgi:hypothetical protein